jgi:hypothetical protein
MRVRTAGGSDGVSGMELIGWLRGACADYRLEPEAVFCKRGSHAWPLVAGDADDLARQLAKGGHLLPLPTEPAALANVIEVSLQAFVLEKLSGVPGVTCRPGTERGYPDIEIGGPTFGGGFHAVDIKVARRGRSGRATQSAITLYTGNTYFRFPEEEWPGGILRPFADYRKHVDLVAIYTFDPGSTSRIKDLELIVQESWRIASRKRSSTTREYIGAVKSIEALRAGRGEFDSEAEFYAYWRKFPFKTPRAVEQRWRRSSIERRATSPATRRGPRGPS